MIPHDEFTSRAKRSKRSDGLKTRNQLLDAAGRVFAERGYSDATSKEICERAGTNTAAVNYYFGSKDNLYEEVLVEAHKQLISFEDIAEITSSDASPEEKLAYLLSKLIRTARTSSRSWGVKVVLRELVSTSPLATKALVPAVQPKVNLALQLIGDIIGRPAGSPEAQRALMFVILPLFSLILFPETLRTRILLSTSHTEADLETGLIRYTLAGLNALKS